MRTARNLFAAFLFLAVAGLALSQGQPPAKLTEAEQKTAAKLRQLGAHVMELAQNDARLEVAFPQSDAKITDEQLALLKDLKTLVHLNLRGHAITDAQLAHVKPLTGLTRLHLEKTKITDKGLENLKGLSNLEYLNLYGTEVTDAGLAQLEGLKKLTGLYLWQTKATKAGAAKLKTALAKTDINLGFEEPPKAPEKKDEKKDKDKKDKK